MGQAASKAAAVKTTAAKATQAATASATKASAQPAAESSAKVIATHLTRDQIEKRSAKAAAVNASAGGADTHDRWRAAPQEKPVELMEMNDDLLEQMKQFEDYDRVDELPASMQMFKDTASSHRPQAAARTAMPSNRTADVASGTYVDEPVHGRLLQSQLRELLRLHYEDPTAWTSASLAYKYKLDHDAVLAILQHVGPPDVLQPRTPLAHPLGVWYPSTLAASNKKPSVTS